jgi:hypothetical protein
MATTRRPASPATTAVTKTAKTQVALPAEIEAQIAADVERFKAKLSTPTGNRIATTLSKEFKLPDGTRAREIKAVIVDYIASKDYYVEKFDPENIKPPTCFALDFVPHKPVILTPSVNSPIPQSNGGCVECVQNQWLPLPDNPKKKRKACRDGYSLALLPLDADATTTLMTIDLSPTAINAFDAYVREVARDFGPLYMVETTFVFDPQQDYATVRCIDPVRAETDLIALAFKAKEEAVNLLSVEPDVSGWEDPAAAAVVAKAKTSSKLAAPRTARTRA